MDYYDKFVDIIDCLKATSTHEDIGKVIHEAAARIIPVYEFTNSGGFRIREHTYIPGKHFDTRPIRTYDAVRVEKPQEELDAGDTKELDAFLESFASLP